MNNCLLFIVALPKVKFAKEVLQPSSTIYIALFFNPKYVLLKTEYVAENIYGLCYYLLEWHVLVSSSGQFFSRNIIACYWIV